jgi:hypothetical protein
VALTTITRFCGNEVSNTARSFYALRLLEFILQTAFDFNKNGLDKKSLSFLLDYRENSKSIHILF